MNEYVTVVHNYPRVALSSLDSLGLNAAELGSVLDLVGHDSLFLVVLAVVGGMGWSEIVGTIAGDDTIFVMMRDNNAAVEFAERLKLIGRGGEK